MIMRVSGGFRSRRIPHSVSPATPLPTPGVAATRLVASPRHPVLYAFSLLSFFLSLW